MKIKLAIGYGVLTWIFTYVISYIINPFITDNTPYINIAIPLSIVLVTTIFAIIYIRNFDSKEVLEGLMLGVIFLLIDFIFDFIFFVFLNYNTPLIENYPIHILFMIILIPTITTFIGYLAQMTIELR